MDNQLYLEWKKRKRKNYNVTDNEIMQNTNFIFTTDANSKKKKRGLTLWD